ncbi:MAG: 4-hydroxy-tetrahydrodipicolinate reductase [Actinomycetota bacterium]
MIRVGVLGAAGRMGREVCRAVAGADGLELVAAVDPNNTGLEAEGLLVAATFESLAGADVDVAVDFTHPSTVMPNTRWCLRNGIHAVVGTTGLTPADLDELDAAATAGEANCIVAPNFALGAVLLLRFAAQAARYFDAAEVIELHHDGKADAPSGTAIATARVIGAARAGDWSAPEAVGQYAGARGTEVDGVRVHAVRLPGLVAHEEVLFGGPGQTLTLRHDTMDRAAFMPGVLLAVRAVGERPGLTVGLDVLLD